MSVTVLRCCPVDSALSFGQHYPPIELLGLGISLKNELHHQTEQPNNKVSLRNAKTTAKLLSILN